VRLRIGIHSGMVVWGSVGPPGQARPTVMGDTVNLASRLQRAAHAGGVLVSEAICRQVRGAFHCVRLEPMAVRGKSEPVAVYEVTGEREHVEPMARPPFVDRGDELAQLADLLARARRGRAQVVIVMGEPGVGKTRLVEEFAAVLPGDLVVLRAACPAYGGTSLRPLADLFRQLAGLHGPVSVEDVAARVPFGDRAMQAAAVLSRLFDLAVMPDGEEVPHETALLVAAEAVRRMLQRPTLVWIEDLQWADAGTRELLPFMVDRMVEVPMLLVGTQRGDAPPLAWGRRTSLGTLHLGPLAEADARALVAAVLGQHLPDPVERALVAKAGGNPFYLNEIIATLRSSGAVVQDDRGHWRVTGSVDDVLPDTIQAAVLTRLDRLAPDLRGLVQRAAVIGSSFAASLLHEVSQGDDVAARLSEVEEADIVRRHDPLASDPEYAFVHPLLREVAYANLLAKQRAAMHRQIAEAMERLYADRLEEVAKAIGVHYTRAGCPDLALPHLIVAGESAAARYATREAIELLEWARRLAGETGGDERCLAACELLGELYLRVQDRGPKAWFEVWEFVRSRVDPARDPMRRARATILAAHALAYDNQIAEARRYLDEAASLIPAGHVLWSDYHRVRAHALIMDSEYRRGLDAAREAVTIADRAGTLQDRSRAYAVLAHPAILPLMGDEGRRVMRAWMAEVARAGDERLLIEARHFLISDVWTRGVVDEELLQTAQEALRKAEEHGWTRDETTLNMLLGWAEFLAGRWPAADRHIGRAHQLVEEHGGRMQGQYAILLPYFRGNLAMAAGRLEEGRGIFEQALAHARFHAPIWLNHDLARCLTMLGDADGARAAMERSQEARERLGCVICGCQADGVAAEFYAAVGDDEREQGLATSADAAAADIGHVVTRIRVRRARARLALRAAAGSAAMAAAAEAVELGRRMPLLQPLEHAQSLMVLAEACRLRGDRGGVAAVLQDARSLLAELGARWHLVAVDAMLAAVG
ncbi:MAG: AAA family ATPase, partial [Firmicutes bacterium]|nr:AAA family ATPase [Bacillota bacterium]